MSAVGHLAGQSVAVSIKLYTDSAGLDTVCPPCGCVYSVPVVVLSTCLCPYEEEYVILDVECVQVDALVILDVRWKDGDDALLQQLMSLLQLELECTPSSVKSLVPPTSPAMVDPDLV